MTPAEAKIREMIQGGAETVLWHLVGPDSDLRTQAKQMEQIGKLALKALDEIEHLAELTRVK